MTTKTKKTTDETQDGPGAGNADSPGPAPAASKAGPMPSLPSFVLDALELDALSGWRFENPGDTAAGVLIRTFARSVPKLDKPEEIRTVMVALIYGVQMTEGALDGPPHYIELVGYSTVLDRHIVRMVGCEQGTLVRATYLGHKASTNKAYNDYADFDVAIGRRDDTVNPEVYESAPALEAVEAYELNDGEPF